MRILRRVALVAASLLLMLVLAAIVTHRPGDPSLFPPKPGEARIALRIVSHGYHAGLIAKRADLARVAARDGLRGLAALAERFSAHEWLEIGWGDEEFYRNVPSLSASTLPHALRALFGLNNGSVLHLVGFDGAPERVFYAARMLDIEIGDEGFRRLADRIDASVGRDRVGEPVILGPGLYGPSLFVRSVGAFHLGAVCNHWVASLLSAAGLPVAPVLATHPAGLFADLIWRGGAREIAR